MNLTSPAPQAPRDNHRTLSPNEIARLLDAAAEPQVRLLVRLLVGTGLRPGEALGLHWGDVDLASGILRVRATLVVTPDGRAIRPPKTNWSNRAVPLVDPLVRALGSRRTAQLAERVRVDPGSTEDDLVFSTPVGEPMDPALARHAIARAAKNCGLHIGGMHVLRLTAASIMLDAGVERETVSEILGIGRIGTRDETGDSNPVEAARAAMLCVSHALGWEPPTPLR